VTLSPRHLVTASLFVLAPLVLYLVIPLRAVAPVAEAEASPYYPSSRCFRNPLYLCIEEVPGAERLGAELGALARAGEALNASDRIDRSAVYRVKLRALERIWEGFGGDAGFERFCREQGQPLVSFASYCVLAERHGPDWRRWPEELRDARSPAVERAAGSDPRRLDFFRWLQWLIDEQLARASRDIAHLHDLPIGVDPGGADAWIWQAELAQGASVGAPPDVYAAGGQDWGLPPFIPHRLRAAAYEPFARTLRASLRHAGGLRIDHVMGLFRLFWIPEGRSPAEGTYVYYPSDDLLAVTALESQRARALIVGEDLGTVEPGTRERLAARDILSYRLLWFEERPPAEYPELALAAVTTHDLPTVAGLWTGSDLDEQRALGMKVNEEETRRVRARLAGMTDLDQHAPLDAVIEAAHRLLADAPCRLLTATLEDLVAAERRPNLPATTCGQRPNWSLPLGRTLEELMRAPLAERVARILHRGPPV
jgi:4-alpha-glucanotransferase